MASAAETASAHAPQDLERLRLRLANAYGLASCGQHRDAADILAEVLRPPTVMDATERCMVNVLLVQEYLLDELSRFEPANAGSDLAAAYGAFAVAKNVIPLLQPTAPGAVDEWLSFVKAAESHLRPTSAGQPRLRIDPDGQTFAKLADLALEISKDLTKCARGLLDRGDSGAAACVDLMHRCAEAVYIHLKCRHLELCPTPHAQNPLEPLLVASEHLNRAYPQTESDYEKKITRAEPKWTPASTYWIARSAAAHHDRIVRTIDRLEQTQQLEPDAKKKMLRRARLAHDAAQYVYDKHSLAEDAHIAQTFWLIGHRQRRDALHARLTS